MGMGRLKSCREYQVEEGGAYGTRGVAMSIAGRCQIHYAEIMKTVTVIKALVIDEAEQCLVLHRSKTHPTMAHKPDLPGGQVEDGEAHLAALCRELDEETGLLVSPSAVQLVYASADAFGDKNYIRLIAAVHLSGSQPPITISNEHEKVVWLPLADVEAYLEHPIYKRALAYIIKHHLA